MENKSSGELVTDWQKLEPYVLFNVDTQQNLKEDNNIIESNFIEE